MEHEEKKVYIGSLVEGCFGIGLVVSIVEDIGHNDHTGWAFKIKPVNYHRCLVDYECNLKLIS
jgi:hypothetical protein